MAVKHRSEPEEGPSFGIHASHYLARAETRLQEIAPQALFYAAFELRCGFEARMSQYLAAQAAVSKKKKKGYQIAKLAKNIEAVFKSGEKYVRLTVEDSAGVVAVELWYSPVTAALRKHAEWCGDLLHAQQRYRKPNDRWWDMVRHRLREMSELLSLAMRGELLGVPLMNPTGAVEFAIEYLEERALHEKLKVGGHHIFRVRYLTDPPQEWLDA